MVDTSGLDYEHRLGADRRAAYGHVALCSPHPASALLNMALRTHTGSCVSDRRGSRTDREGSPRIGGACSPDSGGSLWLLTLRVRCC